jgi:hypothetical protein
MDASQDPTESGAAGGKGRTRASRQPAHDHTVEHDPAEHDPAEPGPGPAPEPASLELDVSAFGPTADDEPRLREAVLAHPDIRSRLADCDHRLLTFRLADPDSKTAEPCPPSRFTATVFDYTNGRMLLAQGELGALDPDAPGSLEVDDVAADPLPSAAEFAAAVDVLRHDRPMRARLEAGSVEVYEPMPPVIETELPDGRRDRTVAVGLRENDRESSTHQIVGVNLFSRRVIDLVDRYDFPSLKPCEPPPGAGSCAPSGTTGQVTVTVSQAGQQLWRFVAVRPAASSGTNGSGIELRYVDYRGKRVLYRAHLPILNIEYLSGAPGGCGPTYRDWQNGETCFQANGVDVIPGFRVCPSPATTILDSGSDAGNFKGVAIYVQGQEVVLVSELSAGWYRYISEWRLRSDGTIRPIFGFSAIDNPCTCSEHIHHAYWRFDFDIRTAWNNMVEEYNDPPLVGSSNWHTKSYETRRPRDPSRKRRWKVSNAATGEGYVLVPGAGDGTADPYGVGDMWALRYRGSEIDDGQGFTTNPALSQAHLDAFRSPAEPIAGTDVVLWYTGHFRHDQAHAAGHRVGPELRPTNW